MSTEEDPYLSKSNLISVWQCPKMLYFEINEPELADYDPQVESLFATGHAVGDIAKELYKSDINIEVGYDNGLEDAIEETKEIIEDNNDEVIYDAVFEFEGILVRADILQPYKEGYKLIEVKATTSKEFHHELECAIQYWVMSRCGVELTGVFLAHINNQFVYEKEGCYEGFLQEVDLTERAKELRPSVGKMVFDSKYSAETKLDVSVGSHCSSPYDCRFTKQCWPSDTKYPLTGLGGDKKKLAEWANAGIKDIRDVSSDDITSETHHRIHATTLLEKPEVNAQAKNELNSLPYPRYYLDFESINPAIPIWLGFRPYQAVPIQYSCHIQHNSDYDSLDHVEFLELEDMPPLEKLADQLISDLGDKGPVFMYSDYEKKMIQALIDIFPDKKASLDAIIDRLVDLLPIVKNSYYHPDMLGSWSIKKVMPTINTEFDYAKLDGIKEGSAASEGFIEAIKSETDSDRKKELESQLKRYCKFDTEAMVELVKFFESYKTE